LPPPRVKNMAAAAENASRLMEALVKEPAALLEKTDLVILIRRIREVFENHFDRTWFSLILDGLPIDFRTVREIRILVSLDYLHPGDERQLAQGVEELEIFIRHVRKYLLPVIRERLGVSALRPDRIVKDKTQRLIRKLVAYTFPYNLESLALLTRKLKSQLEEAYSLSLGSA